MKRSFRRAVLAVALLLAVPCARTARADGPPPTPPPPANVGPVGVIADASEPGTRLVFSGQVFAPDGVTPAPGVYVYAYQTDGSGQYHNDPQTRVARLHGWAKTDAQGRFEFRTIHPGAYPGGRSRRTSTFMSGAVGIHCNGLRTYCSRGIPCSNRNRFENPRPQENLGAYAQS